MSLKCALCNTEEFKTEKQFQEHLEGKKHKKLESIKKSRLDSSERSIFVSNLPKNTFTKHLQDYFVRFGVVKKTIIDLEKNAYAIIEFETKESVDKVMNHPAPHQINEKTVRIKRREVKEFVAKSGPTTAEKKKEILDKLKDEALAVNTLLGKCQTFDEQVEKLVEFLKISDEQLKQREQVCNQLNEIFKKFWAQNDFQVKIFGSSANGLACNGSDMDLTLLLNSYLAQNAERQQVLPKVIARGRDQLKKQDSKDSSHDGGATNSSGSNIADPDHLEENVDLEMDEMEFDQEDTGAGSESHEQALARKILKENIAEFFSQKAYDKLITYSVENQVKIVAQVIQRFLVDIKTLRTITNTRCPLVSFFHNKANTNCDLSLNNFLAVENTNLIKLYMNLEPNLRKLIFVIRYWMKQKNLYASSRFNSYTIIWLIIFYMQKKQIGNLPTVEELCQLSGKPTMIHGWNVAFETDLGKIKALKPVPTAAYSFNDLLKGFFEFYSQYQFFINDTPCYISTRQAKLLYDIEQSPLSKKHAFINVQDPFDLSHNISGNISKNTLGRFVSECKASNELLNYSAPLKKSETKCWGLILLMTRKALPLTLPGSSVTKMALSSPASLATDKQLLNQPGSADLQDEETKAKKAVEFVLHLFKHCLLFEQVHDEQLLNQKRQKRLKVLSHICDKVDTIELNSSPKRIRISENTSADPSNPSSVYACVTDNNNNKNNEDSDEEKPVESSSRTIAVYQMVVKKNTWQGRRAIKRNLKADGKAKDDELEREISTMLAAKQETEPKHIHFAVTFSLNKTKTTSQPSQPSKSDLSYLKIKFDLLDGYENQEDLMNFTTFVHFLDIFISNCQEKYFDKWNQSKVVC